ncbi:MAG TPA: putative zinc-binding metallopeptidase [Steroidobacteraceae bacterium]|nr:putative zinc-binding metallopeptidase [Steroidobacteraceae bacterium]
MKRRAWTRLPDAELLKLRFCDLKLKLKGTRVAPKIRKLYAELDARGLEFHPHCWLAEEWFSPDGIPGIAIPFYLAHPRLERLERHLMREVEGGNSNWLMRILRHEAGHALDTAFRLRRKRLWREVFGPASLPYPDSYRARPGSRRFVQHLGAWYAQSHPTEDFAETFAVWLKPRSRWRAHYADWPAIEKLEFVEQAMQELRGRRAKVRSRDEIEPLRTDTRTLAQHYRRKIQRYRRMRRSLADQMIRRIFGTPRDSRRALPAATFVRRIKPDLLRLVRTRSAASDYAIHQALRLIVERCVAGHLTVNVSARAARRNVLWLSLRLLKFLEQSAGPRVAV